MYTTGEVLGTSTAIASAIILPNTGGNVLLTISASLALIVGVAVVATSVVREIAKKSYKK